MATKKTGVSIKNFYLSAIAAGLLVSVLSCSQKIAFQSSSVVPAAEGSLKVKTDNNNNYVIQMELFNLADPQNLQPAKQAYVVWMETEQQAAKNIGQVSNSSGFLTKKLRASFETVTPVKPTKIFITAEDDAAVQYPGMQVLTTGNF
jgi:hypothetical protein